jgi:hypothetical protein
LLSDDDKKCVFFKKPESYKVYKKRGFNPLEQSARNSIRPRTVFRLA